MTTTNWVKTSMNNLELVNHLRQVSLDQFHKQLDFWQKNLPADYIVVMDFIMTLQPEKKFKR